MDITLPFISWEGHKAFHASFHAILAKIKAAAWLLIDTCAAQISLHPLSLCWRESK